MTSGVGLASDIQEKRLPSGWRWAKMGEVCLINPRRPLGFSRNPEAPTNFVPMSAVDEERAVIDNLETRPYREVARGYTYFEDGDVLFAKITPCMQNGKSAIAAGLIDGIGFGSTEFHVLRPSELACAEWMLAFLRQPTLRDEAVRHFVGAVGQQRLPHSFLANCLIPLPPLAEQSRIVSIMAKPMTDVERLRRAASVQVDSVKVMRTACLHHIFERDSANKWQLRRLGELTTRISKGESPAWQGFQYVSDGCRFIRSENVLWGEFSLAPQTFIAQAFHEKLSRSQVKAKDVLVNLVGASIGRACVVPDNLGEANVNQAVAVMSLREDVDPDYLVAFILSPPVQGYFQAAQVEVARPNISLQNLHDLRLPVPPLSVQQVIGASFRSIMVAVAKMLRADLMQLEAINQLPGAMLSMALAGGL